MFWLVGLSGVVLSVAACRLFVTVAGRVFSWIPSAAFRRVYVILCVAVLGIAGLLLIAAAVSDPEGAWNTFSSLLPPFGFSPPAPSIYWLGYWTTAAGFLALFSYTVLGVLPQPNVPYQPRAAAWKLPRASKHFAAALVIFVLAVLLQDCELRWRLNGLVAEADRIAESTAPPPVPDEENAALMYVQTSAIDAAVKEWAVERLDCGKTWLDCCVRGNPVQDLRGEAHRAAYLEQLKPLVDSFARGAALPAYRCNEVHLWDPLSLNGRPSHPRDGVWATGQYALLSALESRVEESANAIRAMRRFVDGIATDPRGIEPMSFSGTEHMALWAIACLASGEQPIREEVWRSLIADDLPTTEIIQRCVQWQGEILRRELVAVYTRKKVDRPGIYLGGGDPDPESYLQFLWLRMASAREDLYAMRRMYTIETTNDISTVRLSDDMAGDEGRFLFDVWSSAYSSRHVLEAESYRSLANLGVAAALYRQTHDHWPETLDALDTDLIADSITDPLTEKNFIVLATDDGLILYRDTENNRAYVDAFDDSQAWWEEPLFFEPMLFLGDAFHKSFAVNW